MGSTSADPPVPGDDAARPPLPALAGVGLVSAATIVLQVALTRVFSISLWHHFAYLVIGIALLGFGIAGSWLTARGGAWIEKDGRLESAIARRATHATWLSLAGLLVMFTIRPNALGVFKDPSVGIALTLIVALTSIPFLGAGAVIGTALSIYRGRAGIVYAADLVGAGAGAALSSWALGPLAAPQLAFAAIALLGGGALFFCLRAGRAAMARGAVALALPLGLVVFYGEDEHWVRAAPAKEINSYHFPDLDEPQVEHRAWTPQGRIDVSKTREQPPYHGGDINLLALFELRIVTQDGSAPTALYRLEKDPADLGFIPFSSTAAVWEMKGHGAHRGPPPPNGPDVLVIGMGGGVDGLVALAYGARSVTGVDINAEMIRNLTTHFADYTGRLAYRPGVRLVHADGRSFVRASQDRYGVIQLSGVDTFTALASGAYSIAEAYVYTVEAFEDYLAHLAPGGCLSMSRLILEPPRETLRLAGSAAEAMRRAGDAEPWRRIAVLRGKYWATLLACERPITPEEMMRLHAWAGPRGFHVRFDPHAFADEPFARLLAGDESTRAELIAGYPYRLDPATDEAPFFFDYYRWKNVFEARRMTQLRPYSNDVPVGHALLLGALVVTSVLAAVGIFVPLRRLRIPPSKSRRAFLVYFAGLGLGFLFVEAALLQRFTYLLGHPTRAITLVLGALLVSAGIGAAASRRLGGTRGFRVVGIVVPAGVLGAAFVSWSVLPSAIGLEYAARVGVALAVLVPLGFFLGIPFPAGLERIRARAPELVPWAFAVNAFFTVLASSLAPILAMQIGFSALLALAAAVYAAAFAATARLREAAQP